MSSTTPQQTQKDRKAAKRAAALRANLKRRKEAAQETHKTVE